MRALQQQAKGKADAVRLGFSQASSEVLTILDADLTMPPERLTRFYEAYCEGAADFINGTRLVYPMEGEAMRLLNHLANVFFAKMLSFVLDARLGDSLCGTKMVSRHDYERFVPMAERLRRLRPVRRLRAPLSGRRTWNRYNRYSGGLQGANLRHDQHPAVSRRVYAVANDDDRALADQVRQCLTD